MIGFRNPVRHGKALVVPLENPADLLQGKKPRFGQPIGLDLGRRGIRSIERVGGIYWIVAGPTGDRRDGDKEAFALYRWSGRATEPASRMPEIDFNDLSPEALFAWPDGSLQVLSDDGGLVIDGKRCKDLDRSERRFRSTTLGRVGSR